MKTTYAGMLAVWLVACAPAGESKLSLNVRTGAPGTKSGALTQGLALANGIQVDRIRIVVKKLELEAANGKESEEGDDVEVEAGPFLIDLAGAALDGGIHEVLTAQVPPGEYREVKFQIHPLEEKEAQSNAAFQELLAKKASILVDGTVDQAAFAFASGLDEEQKLESKVSIGASANGLTLNIDPSGWFTASGGSRLDPRQESARSAIEANIKRSIDAYDDDDEDGEDDDAEHEGGGDDKD